MPAARATGILTAAPYDYADVQRIAAALELAEPVATALVRRGHRTVEEASAFLEASERHQPTAFAGIDDAVAAIRKAMAGGRRITVHGDYDVDGICATAILVATLRRLGADCDWLIPDRLGEGYGLSMATVPALLERGTGLLITADCGITCAEEVEALRGEGVEVVVTDHHQPAERLPECPIVHPEVCSYPFAGLCGAAVAHKLACALDDPGAAEAGRDLDLVALATVADLVPLVGENRALVRAGLSELRRARRPGIRALMAAAAVEPERIDEGDIAFRLAPRLNAAGRLYRADAGVELMLTDDDARATSIAAELDSANHERRRTERELVGQAETALRELPGELRDAPGIVLAGAGWHPGVVGIVASRLAERHGRPTVLIALDGEGRGRGSGRSVAGFDLLAALRGCSEHLVRYGGHRAAAGLEIEAAAVDAFRLAFLEHARTAMPDGPAAEPDHVDAVVGVEALDLRVAEQLGRLGPFGRGNPEIRLLVPSTRIGGLRTMGEDGKHARFELLSAGARASGVAFNVGRALAEAERIPHDLTVRLEVNHWNGSIQPRAVLAGTRSAGAGPAEDCRCRCEATPGAGWWRRLDRELTAPLPGEEGPLPSAEVAAERRTPGATTASAMALIGELLSSGARVMVLCASAARRAEIATLAAAGGRFGATYAAVCDTCPEDALAAAAGDGHAPRLVLCEWPVLASRPAEAAGFDHLVAVDPPAVEGWWKAAEGSGEGWLHRCWQRGAGEDRLAELCWDAEWKLRPSLAAIYRAAADGPLSGEALAAAVAGGGRHPRSAAAAGRCLRVLDELGLAALEGNRATRTLRVVSSKRTDLERSDAYRAFAARHEEGRRFLESRRAER